MSTKNKNRLRPTRRQVLTMAGTCGALAAMRSPLDVLISGLVEGLVRKSHASDISQPRNFLHLNFSGGPCRWFFDLPLRPYDGCGDYIHDPQVVTRFNEQGIPEYHTIPITVKGQKLHMPTLWGTTIPTTTGEWIPMTSLLENMLMIRGVNMRADGHPPNNNKQVRPAQDRPSLTGLVADRSNKPVPAVGASPGTPYVAYHSEKGIGQTVLPNLDGYPDLLSKVLGPFDASGDKLPPKFLEKRKALDLALKRSLAALGEYAKQSHPGTENLFALRHKAEGLLRKGLGDVDSVYASLKAKYTNLIHACRDRNIPGVMDRPIPPTAFARKLSRTVTIADGKRTVARNADLRDIITEKTYIYELAEGCAIAEYLIINGYSSTVLWGTTRVANLDFKDLAKIGLDKAGNEIDETPLNEDLEGTMPNDEHFTGNAISLLANTYLFRCVAACLYELIKQLKAAHLFDETVIQLGAEFSRIPRTDFGGSEHGWMANCTSLFSGAIPRPIVLGDIYTNVRDGVFNTRETTWGMSAPMQVDGTEQNLTIGHSTSTIAHLLRVEAPVPNNGSLIIADDSGHLTPTVDLAKNRTMT